MPGYVYILSNPSMPDIYKIGQTSKHPNERAKELSQTSTPTPFQVVYYLLVENPEKAEADIHAQFSEFRITEKREFFKVLPSEIILYMRDNYEPNYKALIETQVKLESSERSEDILDKHIVTLHKKLRNFEQQKNRAIDLLTEIEKKLSSTDEFCSNGYSQKINDLIKSICD